METKKTWFFFLIFGSISVLDLFGQSIDYNKIILPDDAKNVTFEERLVQLAWKNNPTSHMASENVIEAQEQAKVTGTQWANGIGVTGNLNEFTIKDLTTSGTPVVNNNQFFPRYNFYVQLPLSLLLQTPHLRKAARSKITTAEDQVKLAKLGIRTKILKLYSEYKTTELIWLIRKQSMADEESNYLLIEQKFKNGDALLDEYLKGQKNRNDVKIQLAIAENQFLKAKLDIEEIIGMKMEDVR